MEVIEQRIAMKKKFLKVVVFSLLSGFLSNAWAVVDLLEAYQAAVKNDPTFRAQRAEYLSSKEATPQARAALLPQVTLNAQVADRSKSGSSSGDEVTLEATQVVFDWTAFMQLRQAHASVRAAAALFAAQEQDLIQRVVEAYFNVAAAQDVYQASLNQQKNAKTNLDSARERFKHGFATITDIDQAKASYDAAVATAWRANIDKNTAMQALSQITGAAYKRVAGLRFSFPLISPNPQEIQNWVSKAKESNLFLLSAEQSVEAAKRTISVQRGGFAPNIRAFAAYQPEGIEADNEVLSDVSKFNYGLELDYNAFEGLLTLSDIRQAQADYQRALAERAQAYLAAVAETRSSYYSVLKGILQLRAARSSVTSNRSALAHTKSSYMVGVKTILDVLTQQEQLFIAQRDYAINRESYIVSITRLEQASGILAPSTLVAINKWLDKGKENPAVDQGYPLKASVPARLIVDKKNIDKKTR